MSKNSDGLHRSAERDPCSAPPTVPLHESGNLDASVSYFLSFALDRQAHILDVGARFGSFLDRIHETGYTDIHGIDVDEDAVRTGRQSYPHLAASLQTCNGRSIPFDGGVFDAVTMFDVLEHVPDVGAFLTEVRRILKPGGLFIFQTPNILINVPWEILHRRSLTRWRTYHCSLQGVRSLRAALLDTGFEDVHIHKYPIQTEHNIRKVRKALGRLGPWLLGLTARLPLGLYPNLWGNCRSACDEEG
jgi:2-polyprenyl-3-methyl-5-hydroxy-6-metoxy-1,4-benzoquinol methylase